MAKVAPTLNNVEEINTALSKYLGKDDKLALLLDYDGTLSGLVTHPDLAVTIPETEVVLNKLAKIPSIFMSIISGRGAEDARCRAKLEHITYAGNHQLEIIFPNKPKYTHRVDETIVNNFPKMANELEKTAQSVKIIESYGYIACPGHGAVDAKPPVVWNKGEAALYIMRDEFGNDWPGKVKVIYAGDDTSDEDAMKALKGKSLTFRISPNPEIETYRVPSTTVFRSILEWIQNTMSGQITNGTA